VTGGVSPVATRLHRVTETAPTPDDLRAYREGRLDLARFAAVDRWLAGRPPEELERLLGGHDADRPRLPLAPAGDGPATVFLPETTGTRRWREGAILGSGGMGIVEAVRDDLLGREVALKRCRPRRPEEPLTAYTARLRAFRREAAVTAQLEHPGIVPVHDVGAGALGEPAFLMKRLDGEPLSTLIERRSQGEPLDLARIAEIVLRVAEAVGFAHQRGVVHRDLKPANVVIGAFGAVHVIDWGLAARRDESLPSAQPGSAGTKGSILGGAGLCAVATGGEHARKASAAQRPDGRWPPGAEAGSRSEGGAPRSPPPITTDTEIAVDGSGFQTTNNYRVGTPAWMAPEQFGGASASPAMDVFALGGLLMALLTGRGPRDHPGGEGTPPPGVALAPLGERGLPKGLVAVARRCLALDPALRYADGAAVADDLRRWLSAGLTLAERPQLWQRWWAYLRHSPYLVAAVAGLAAALLVTAGTVKLLALRADRRALGTLKEIEATIAYDDPDTVHTGLAQVQYLLKDHPALPAALALSDRLTTAEAVIQTNRTLAQHRTRLLGLARDYRQRGPWSGEADALLSALRDLGYLTQSVPQTAPAEIALLRVDPLRVEVLASLVQLQRAFLLGEMDTPLREQIPALIAAAGPTPAWRALGEVLANTLVDDHDLIFKPGPAADLALDDSAIADLMLATYGPEPQLLRVAHDRLHEDAGAFWPRVICARDSLNRGDWQQAERHALVALGQEPDGLWPHLALAYVALAAGHDVQLLREAEAGLDANPDHLELVVLKAVALARTGKLAAAQRLIDGCQAAGHLQYHLQHRNGHPMERSVAALAAAGVRIPDAPPALGPLVRPRGH
jgi:serine/threonine protein kinase